ncbi:MAG TPA: D-glycerate dehydrogenase [Burkholderiaceae bacterium]
MKKILIARPTFPATVERLRLHFEVDFHDADPALNGPELIARLQGRQGLYASPSTAVNAAVFEACPDLRVVANMAVGYNNIDLAAAARAGVIVTNTPGVLDNATADFAWALLLAAARRVTEAEQLLRDGKWTSWRYDSMLGADTGGATLGILGMGRIGAAIARRAAGFDMQVLYHNRTPAHPHAAPGARYTDKDTLLATCDHVIVAVPYTPQTHHLIGPRELALMKPTAVLVNIARGGVVDDAALAVALQERRIAAAGLDVFENEPAVLPALLACTNVVLTPHIASATLSARKAMAELAADNLIAALSGQEPLNRVALPPSN